MKIHEYQAKDLFRKASVPVLEGHVARSADEAAAAFKSLGKQIFRLILVNLHRGLQFDGLNAFANANNGCLRRAAEGRDYTKRVEP